MNDAENARLRSLIVGGRAKLVRVDFSGARLDTVAARGQLFVKYCSFAGADLRHATLDGVGFGRCDLSGADLRGASLRGARFHGCDLSGADLRGADLHGATFGTGGAGQDARPTTLTGARLDRNGLHGAILEHVEL
ncbi:pentapeptide repeat-containing protein [Cellulomonas sp. HZM]|uniref:pentapeptide repeat-containing protein n=1 Tax=Cellulomonas sp. HZM TaxID=1454010 RepID=UPI00068F6BFE|nr:pentapeptide repeat-containing protein [Cellulomonas sp. HZM]